MQKNARYLEGPLCKDFPEEKYRKSVPVRKKNPVHYLEMSAT